MHQSDPYRNCEFSEVHLTEKKIVQPSLRRTVGGALSGGQKAHTKEPHPGRQLCMSCCVPASLFHFCAGLQTAVWPVLRRVAGTRHGRAARVVQHITQGARVASRAELCGHHRHGRLNHDIGLVAGTTVSRESRVKIQNPKTQG